MTPQFGPLYKAMEGKPRPRGGGNAMASFGWPGEEQG